MEQHFKTIRQTRNNFIQLLDSCTLEEANQVPEGFNNNIIWNFGHIIASLHGLCYTLSGLKAKSSPDYLNEYRKGTKPERFIGQDEVNELKELMLNTVDELEEDLKNQVFINYNAYTTSYGVTLNDIQDAVQFFPIHDAYHYGCATAIKRIINNNKN